MSSTRHISRPFSSLFISTNSTDARFASRDFFRLPLPSKTMKHIYASVAASVHSCSNDPSSGPNCPTRYSHADSSHDRGARVSKDTQLLKSEPDSPQQEQAIFGGDRCRTIRRESRVFSADQRIILAPDNRLSNPDCLHVLPMFSLRHEPTRQKCDCRCPVVRPGLGEARPDGTA